MPARIGGTRAGITGGGGAGKPRGEGPTGAAGARYGIAQAVQQSRPPVSSPCGNVEITGLARNWANFKTLLGIFSQTDGPACEFWANPANFSFANSDR